MPPLACTASVTLRHAAACAAVWMPGVWIYPLASALIWLPSVMINRRWRVGRSIRRDGQAPLRCCRRPVARQRRHHHGCQLKGTGGGCGKQVLAHGFSSGSILRSSIQQQNVAPQKLSIPLPPFNPHKRMFQNPEKPSAIAPFNPQSCGQISHDIRALKGHSEGRPFNVHEEVRDCPPAWRSGSNPRVSQGFDIALSAHVVESLLPGVKCARCD